MDDKAPELRPLARRAVVTKLNAYWRATGETETVRDRLFESWAVRSLEELQSQLGTTIGKPAFEHLLASGTAAAPNQVTAAVVSCAVSHLPSDLLAEALKGTSEESALELTEDSLEETLVRQAGRLGYPIELARALALGSPQTNSIRNGRASQAAQHRFLESLDQETRDLITTTRLEAKAKRDSVAKPGTPGYGPRSREAALQVLRAGDARRNSIPREFYLWLLEHDTEWLDLHFPRRHGAITPAVRAARREAALALKAQGATTRAGLQAASPPAVSWLRTHDLRWLKEHFPGVRAVKANLSSGAKPGGPVL